MRPRISPSLSVRRATSVEPTPDTAPAIAPPMRVSVWSACGVSALSMALSADRMAVTPAVSRDLRADSRDSRRWSRQCWAGVMAGELNGVVGWRRGIYARSLHRERPRRYAKCGVSAYRHGRSRCRADQQGEPERLTGRVDGIGCFT